MKIEVKDESGELLFSYDTLHSSICLSPSCEDLPRVLDAIAEVNLFLQITTGSEQADKTPRESESWPLVRPGLAVGQWD